MSSPTSGFSEIDDLYQDIILDHYRSPRNQKEISEFDLEVIGINPFCGDEVHMQISLTDESISAVSFNGNGCSISQASASILSDIIKGKTLDQANELYGDFRDMMHGKDLNEISMDNLGQAEALSGVKKFPIRIKCALLAWSALNDAVIKHNSL
jgi:nitrogen fixation NifU-like protein